MDIYYRNNNGQEVNLMETPYCIQESDLLNYSWEYETRGEISPKIKRFFKRLAERKIKIAISAGNLIYYRMSVENLSDVIEKDINSLSPGRLYVNDMYLSCFFVASTKSTWVPGVNFLVNEFSIISERGQWIKEEKYTFRADVSIGIGEKNLDYPYDYKCDFASEMNRKTIKNNSVAPVEFEITIFGNCLNPSVNIGGHTYRVYASLDTGEYLKINSITKKIYKVKANGEIVNQFNLRERDYYIFQKIQPGINSVTWSGAYGVDITLFEERSEPRWI